MPTCCSLVGFLVSRQDVYSSLSSGLIYETIMVNHYMPLLFLALLCVVFIELTEHSRKTYEMFSSILNDLLLF